MRSLLKLKKWRQEVTTGEVLPSAPGHLKSSCDHGYRQSTSCGIGLIPPGRVKWGRILCCACQEFFLKSAHQSHGNRSQVIQEVSGMRIDLLAHPDWPCTRKMASCSRRCSKASELAPLAMTMQANGQRESGEILCLERLINPQNSLLGQQEGDAVGQVGHAESVQAEKGTGRFSRGAKSHAASIGRRPRERGVDSNLSLAGDFIGCGVSCVNHGLRVDQHVGLYGNEPLCSL